MDLVSRLKIFMDSKGIASTQFADMCEIPRPTVSQILNGRNKKISDEIIRRIHSAFPTLSVSWLMFGEGEMESGSNIRFSEPQTQQKSSIVVEEQLDKQSNIIAKVPLFYGTEPRPEKFNAPKETTFAAWHAENERPATSAIENDATIGRSNDYDSKVSGNIVREDVEIEQKQTGNRIKVGKNERRIKSITVFYDDNTFETFIPSNGKDPI